MSDDDNEGPPADNAGVQEGQQADPEPTTDADESESESEEKEQESVAEGANASTDQDGAATVRVTRSGRTSRPPSKLTLAQHHLQTQAHSVREQYSNESARVIAMTMICISDMLFNPMGKTAHQFMQSYSLMKGLKKFGQKGRQPHTKR